MKERNLVIGGIYKHFKGNEYIVKHVAKHTETGELFVIYANVHDSNQVWARPHDDFMSEVDRTKYPEVTQTHRFELQQNADGLKPCPFCGGVARWKYRKPVSAVVCKKCGAMSYMFCDEHEEMDSKKQAVEAWNRRVGDN